MNDRRVTGGTLFLCLAAGQAAILVLSPLLTSVASDLMSTAAPGFAVLAAAELFIGIGVGLSYSAAIAAVAEWTTPENRSRVLAIALLGPPLAWVVGMPLCGVVGDVSWRLAWIAVPLA